jgi:hypothetical protein
MMRCPACGNSLSFLGKKCLHCGCELSPYVHLLGVLSGVAGSLIGFTFADLVGALIGGLFGIALYVIVASQCRRKMAARKPGPLDTAATKPTGSIENQRPEIRVRE